MSQPSQGENAAVEYGDFTVDPKIGLWWHTRNAFSPLLSLRQLIHEGESEELTQIALLGLNKPLENYEWWVRYQTQVKPDEADQILANSNLEKVKAFNSLIDEFNQRRESIISDIKSSGNRKLLEDFYQR